ERDVQDGVLRIPLLVPYPPGRDRSVREPAEKRERDLVLHHVKRADHVGLLFPALLSRLLLDDQDFYAHALDALDAAGDLLVVGDAADVGDDVLAFLLAAFGQTDHAQSHNGVRGRPPAPLRVKFELVVPRAGPRTDPHVNPDLAVPPRDHLRD